MAMSESARAASAAEARFRINAAIAPARAPRIVALDARAAGVVRRVAAHQWANARFVVCEGLAPGANRGDASPDSVLLRDIEGTPVLLSEELTRTDAVFMVASDDSGAACAWTIGRACAEHGVMTAGFVLGDGFEADGAVAGLRPHARVLLPTADESDVVEVLRALRA
ncbi:hypothetical protein ACQPZQ_32780 [Pseudonocardia sp. CA-142604]|uniref:hypothetical protein n=1 Tax=Pseudonocardia sp. CA-142604 TaxID=3240024 RepID=UPI003D8B2C8D